MLHIWISTIPTNLWSSSNLFNTVKKYVRIEFIFFWSMFLATSPFQQAGCCWLLKTLVSLPLAMVVWTLLASIEAIRFAFYTLCEVVQMFQSGQKLLFSPFFFLNSKLKNVYHSIHTHGTSGGVITTGWASLRRVKQILAGGPGFEQIASLFTLPFSVRFHNETKRNSRWLLPDWNFFLIGFCCESKRGFFFLLLSKH